MGRSSHISFLNNDVVTLQGCRRLKNMLLPYKDVVISQRCCLERGGHFKKMSPYKGFGKSTSSEDLTPQRRGGNACWAAKMKQIGVPHVMALSGYESLLPQSDEALRFMIWVNSFIFPGC